MRYIEISSYFQNENVTFCGYSIPHPAEDQMSLRIQTNGVPAQDVLRKGLQDLKEICKITKNKFEAEHAAFESRKMQ